MAVRRGKSCKREGTRRWLWKGKRLTRCQPGGDVTRPFHRFHGGAKQSLRTGIEDVVNVLTTGNNSGLAVLL
jgi:hypothetical protein